MLRIVLVLFGFASLLLCHERRFPLVNFTFHSYLSLWNPHLRIVALTASLSV